MRVYVNVLCNHLNICIYWYRLYKSGYTCHVYLHLCLNMTAHFYITLNVMIMCLIAVHYFYTTIHLHYSQSYTHMYSFICIYKHVYVRIYLYLVPTQSINMLFQFPSRHGSKCSDRPLWSFRPNFRVDIPKSTANSCYCEDQWGSGFLIQLQGLCRFHRAPRIQKCQWKRDR